MFQTWTWFKKSISDELVPGNSQEMETPVQGPVVATALLLRSFSCQGNSCHSCTFCSSIPMHSTQGDSGWLLVMGNKNGHFESEPGRSAASFHCYCCHLLSFSAGM